MTKVLYNDEELKQRRPGPMHRSPNEHAPIRKRPRKRRARRIWDGIVMTVGYLAIAYNLIRGVIYLLVLAEEWM